MRHLHFIAVKYSLLNLHKSSLPTKYCIEIDNGAGVLLSFQATYSKTRTICNTCDDLHWLPIRQRVMYKLCTIVHKCLHAAAPPYLSELCIAYQSPPALDVISCVQQHNMAICSCQGRQRQHTDLAVSPSPDLLSGISYLRLCVYHRHLDSFKAS